MENRNTPPRTAFMTFMTFARKVYNPIGFAEGHNAAMWFVFVGALFCFAVIRLQYLNFSGVFCNPNLRGPMTAMPGECFYYTTSARDHVGIILHLATILPGTILACLQFVPTIRHKAILFHRINGYAVLLLAFVGTIGALMIARHSAGGGVDVQTFVGLLAIMFLGSLGRALYSVKSTMIGQHRAWMIRAWAYAGVIVTMRLGMFLGAMIISHAEQYLVQPCDKINFTLKGERATMQFYPECGPFFSGENPGQKAVVRAKYLAPGNVMEVAAAFDAVFGPAAWLALALHASLVEFYLAFNPH
ncbi:hypothetical protein F4802DRAFT_599363 [Xylaria palmicola]|nr:hypothetical protein F4802DRAFT_599363 [Xylaria palmicola]